MKFYAGAVHGDDVARSGAEGGDVATWRRSTVPACPQKQCARSLKIVGKRVSAEWQAGPAGTARGRRLAEQADSPDVATWRRSTERGFPQNRVAPGISKAGMRLGATWQWAQVALNSSGSKMGADRKSVV